MKPDWTKLASLAQIYLFIYFFIYFFFVCVLIVFKVIPFRYYLKGKAH